MKIFSMLATGMSFFLAGITFFTNLSAWVTILWLLCGIANLFVCMW